MNIKEFYLKFEDWYSKQDPDKINLISSDRNFRYKFNEDFYFNMRNFKEIKQSSDYEKSLIFGDTVLELSDISKVLLEKISVVEQEFNNEKNDFETLDLYKKFYKEEYNGLYDSAGYASPKLVSEIKHFWDKLDNSKVISILTDVVQDDYEIDLAGGRRYLTRNYEILIFNYSQYNQKFDYILDDNEILKLYEFNEFDFDSFDVEKIHKNVELDIINKQNSKFNNDINKIIDSIKGNVRFH